MAVEQRWEYERTVEGGEAEGRQCVFCRQLITRQPYAALWLRKAVEDHADADFPTEDGYAHVECSDRERAQRRRGGFELPEVPDLPRRP